MMRMAVTTPPESACAVILAAGCATRTGTLSTVGKTHVRYRSAPVLAGQLALLSQHGISEAAVVCRPGNASAVALLVAQVGPPLGITVRVGIQDATPGPGRAFAESLKWTPVNQPVLLLLADTVVDSLPPNAGGWIGVASPLHRRRWCAVRSDQRGLVSAISDEEVGPESGQPVAVGVYRFGDRQSLDKAAFEVMSAELPDEEVELSRLLDVYRAYAPLRSEPVAGWVDLGSAEAIARASRGSHVTRAVSSLRVDDLGVAHKRSSYGGAVSQARFMRRPPGRSAVLFPRFLGMDDDELGYSMEYLDYPTLAEIYLYRPGAEENWGDLVGGIIERVDRLLWRTGEVSVDREDLQRRCRVMYLEKPRQRFRKWWAGSVLSRSERLIVNGRELLAGLDALEKLVEHVEPLCDSAVPATVHGDLNFSNILYCEHPRTFRLLDPRGEFGGTGPLGDARYDAAKLRHSYAGMYDAAVHGLYRLETVGPEEFTFSLGPSRAIARRAVDAALRKVGFSLREVRVIEASLFFSMLPLHDDDPQRQWVFYLRALQLLHELTPSVESATSCPDTAQD
ncbi:NTP transferase domain-containing protein [Streptomyces sp. NPDC002520]